MRPNGQDDTPQFQHRRRPAKAGALGLSIADINQTLSTAGAASTSNDFIDRGRVKRVYLQADAPFRMVPEDFDRWSVRNREGEMVPFSAFATRAGPTARRSSSATTAFPAMEIQGEAGAGRQLRRRRWPRWSGWWRSCRPGFGLEWTGLSYEERLSGAQTPLLYALSLLVVFLCLAALYESWSIPVAVMLVVPLGVLGAVLATLAGGLRTTSTSRSACSPRSACRPRTRS